MLNWNRFFLRGLGVFLSLFILTFPMDAATRPVSDPKVKTIKKNKAMAPSKSVKSVKKNKKLEKTPSKVIQTKARRIRSEVPVKSVSAKPAVASFGSLYGLDKTADPLDLKSNVALVIDSQTNEVLLSKNSSAVLPIASITKLMTSLVVLDAGLDLHEIMTITEADVDTEKRSSSRLEVGTQLTRAEMLHLALMSSENRAAHALGRYYPGGLSAFVRAMNVRAQQLQMRDTHFVEPTGLSSKNQSSANDLAILVKAAHQNPLIREYSTSNEATVPVGKKALQFRNTNGLVRGGTWDIALQKTGYIAEAGRCLVMQVSLAGRELVMVLLDSAGKYSRIADAERIRRWVTQQLGSTADVRRVRQL